MNQEQPLVNRVSNSGLVTINLEDFYPKGEILTFDLKDYLFMELILKEKDFRAALAAHNWQQYEAKHLCVYCSNDAIIPVWAYMLVVANAAPFASSVAQTQPNFFVELHFHKTLATLDASIYADKRVVVKGCSDRPVPPAAYAELTRLLRPFAKSIMYGEPCSTVPIYKK